MASTFEWVARDGRVLLSGRIDENAELDLLAESLPAGGATLDLAGLTRINSIGIRAWMDFVARGARPLTLERCPPVFVEQLNAIANFAGTATIASVRIAYECDLDGESRELDVSTADARAKRLPPPPRCPRCGAEMIPAQEHEQYFRFLRF